MTAGTSQSPDDAILLVHAYVDGELDAPAELEMGRRIAADPQLAAERDRILALRQALQDHLPRETAPPGLRARVETAVGLRRTRSRPTWTALAASVVLTALVTGSSAWLWRAPDGQPADSDAIVSAHIRAMMAPQPTDVLSSERHTVKPWFTGRIPEAPRVINLGSAGFPLVGGRVDVIDRQPAATLVYGRRAHLISLVAVAAPGPPNDVPPARSANAGHNIVAWKENGVAYWAVSDLSATDLDNFVRLFRTAPPDQ
jgi:anti-sigma factor RsiW